MRRAFTFAIRRSTPTAERFSACVRLIYGNSKVATHFCACCSMTVQRRYSFHTPISKRYSATLNLRRTDNTSYSSSHRVTRANCTLPAKGGSMLKVTSDMKDLRELLMPGG